MIKNILVYNNCSNIVVMQDWKRAMQPGGGKYDSCSWLVYL